jgi:hypothetical protein
MMIINTTINYVRRGLPLSRRTAILKGNFYDAQNTDDEFRNGRRVDSSCFRAKPSEILTVPERSEFSRVPSPTSRAAGSLPPALNLAARVA